MSSSGMSASAATVETAVTPSMGAGRSTVGAGSCWVLPPPCFSFLVGIADQLQLEGKLYQLPFAVGGEHRGTPLKPERHAGAIRQGEPERLRLRIDGGCG